MRDIPWDMVFQFGLGVKRKEENLKKQKKKTIAGIRVAEQRAALGVIYVIGKWS